MKIDIQTNSKRTDNITHGTRANATHNLKPQILFNTFYFQVRESPNTPQIRNVKTASIKLTPIQLHYLSLYLHL